MEGEQKLARERKRRMNWIDELKRESTFTTKCIVKR
jgi:hypothetical protein